MLLYAVGGRQKPGVTNRTAEWHKWGAAVVVSVDVDTGRLEACVEYVSPPDVCAEADPSILFKSGTVADGKLFVPTQTELLVYDLPSFNRSQYVSLPCLNDVHHVRPGPEGSLLVANTGLDMVVEVGADERIVREWDVTGSEPWTRFSKEVDYRKVVSTKPHRSHPNHVFFLGGELWVTRCHQMDVLCLTRDYPPVRIDEAKAIHDGLVRDELVYFTVVSGDVVRMDAERRVVRDRFDLNSLSETDVPLGWCRGLEVLDDDHVVVAFSRLRPTKWKENVRWVKHRLGQKTTGLVPTRLAMFDLRKKRLCWEADLEAAGMNVVFSVHRAD